MLSVVIIIIRLLWLSSIRVIVIVLLGILVYMVIRGVMVL
jgi:hypothetical protein